jgi:F-type H+-transporting ATPase subunit a
VVTGLTALVSMGETAEEAFTPPGPGDFDLPPIIGGESGLELFGMPLWSGVTKPMVQLVLAAVIVFVVFRAASARRAMVPGRLRTAGEVAYGFVRNTLGRDVIGSKDFMRFVPLLTAMFFFILLNNVFATIPFFEFPTFSRAGFAYGLAALAWIVYNGAGIRRHGLGGYLKLQTMPSGVPVAMLVILVPLEFFSNILVRPFTLALRLFANMFAGHLLLILFALGGEYLLLEGSAALKPVGVLTWLLFIVIAFLELLVQFLQAFIFTILTSLYISSAVADEH